MKWIAAVFGVTVVGLFGAVLWSATKEPWDGDPSSGPHNAGTDAGWSDYRAQKGVHWSMIGMRP
jgi:hypothetical protein